MLLSYRRVFLTSGRGGGVSALIPRTRRLFLDFCESRDGGGLLGVDKTELVAVFCLELELSVWWSSW